MIVRQKIYLRTRYIKHVCSLENRVDVKLSTKLNKEIFVMKDLNFELEKIAYGNLWGIYNKKAKEDNC